MSAPSLTSYIVKRPWLKRWMTPIAEWYMDAAGYRRLGLRFDDIIPEENDVVQAAIKRLSAKESYDRVFRIRRAFQCSISHTLLPPEEQTKPSEDVEYLSPIIREIEKERKEREDLDTLSVRR
ncbi:ubiquinol--cytochrome-c reductase subunit 7 [Aspergillus ruber CBS 135680]|uniref:Cytochrome b-c1 complex subunit 7 n=1 Tax=Aspergillus ruber (strain CBS 135680) TaxID=1388766 RepID=A0A017SLN1_ASPRC|nr:ubiquinol-cytochrome c reductase complex 14 kDa protein [Aspergillus ruber CBS 135680]EYE97878.1 ubiquinol-cytochrome c reductase complex 14 kDa protein [Aspergillus ruber CBS 135680]